MQSLLAGIVLGWGVAVPVGPVNILIMQFALRSFGLGFAAGAGAMSVDAIYLLALSFGVLHFLQSKLVLDSITIFGALFLLYIAYCIFKGAKSPIKASSEAAKTGAKSFAEAYIKGFMLNLVNPYVIIFWLSVTGFVASMPSGVMALVGLLAAIFSWIVFLPYIVSRTKHFLSQKAVMWIAYGSSALIAVFAVVLLLKRFVWGE